MKALGTTCTLILTIFACFANAETVVAQIRNEHEFIAALTAEKTDYDPVRPAIIFSLLKRNRHAPASFRNPRRLLGQYKKSVADFEELLATTKLQRGGNSYERQSTLFKYLQATFSGVLTDLPYLVGQQMTPDAAYTAASVNSTIDFSSKHGTRLSVFDTVGLWNDIHEFAAKDESVMEFLAVIYSSEEDLLFSPSAKPSELCQQLPAYKACLAKNTTLGEFVSANEELVDGKSHADNHQTQSLLKANELLSSELTEQVNRLRIKLVEFEKVNAKKLAAQQVVEEFQELEAGFKLVGYLSNFVGDNKAKLQLKQASVVGLSALRIAKATALSNQDWKQFGGIVLAANYAGAAATIFNAFSVEPTSEAQIIQAIVELHKEVIELRLEVRKGFSFTNEHIAKVHSSLKRDLSALANGLQQVSNNVVEVQQLAIESQKRIVELQKQMHNARKEIASVSFEIEQYFAADISTRHANDVNLYIKQDGHSRDLWLSGLAAFKSRAVDDAKSSTIIGPASTGELSLSESFERIAKGGLFRNLDFVAEFADKNLGVSKVAPNRRIPDANEWIKGCDLFLRLYHKYPDFKKSYNGTELIDEMLDEGSLILTNLQGLNQNRLNATGAPLAMVNLFSLYEKQVQELAQCESDARKKFCDRWLMGLIYPRRKLMFTPTSSDVEPIFVSEFFQTRAKGRGYSKDWSPHFEDTSERLPDSIKKILPRELKIWPPICSQILAHRKHFTNDIVEVAVLGSQQAWHVERRTKYPRRAIYEEYRFKDESGKEIRKFANAGFVQYTIIATFIPNTPAIRSGKSVRDVGWYPCEFSTDIGGRYLWPRSVKRLPNGKSAKAVGELFEKETDLDDFWRQIGKQANKKRDSSRKRDFAKISSKIKSSTPSDWKPTKLEWGKSADVESEQIARFNTSDYRRKLLDPIAKHLHEMYSEQTLNVLNGRYVRSRDFLISRDDAVALSKKLNELDASIGLMKCYFAVGHPSQAFSDDVAKFFNERIVSSKEIVEIANKKESFEEALWGTPDSRKDCRTFDQVFTNQEDESQSVSKYLVNNEVFSRLAECAADYREILQQIGPPQQSVEEFPQIETMMIRLLQAKVEMVRQSE